MQGSFRKAARTSIGTRPASDWDRLLVPQLDVETQRRYHQEADRRVMDDALSDDSVDSDDSGGGPAGGGPAGGGPGGGGPAGGGPGPPPVPDMPPTAPPLRFRLKGKTFFVMDVDCDVRPLEQGQYLVPYTQHWNGRFHVARPYPDLPGDGPYGIVPRYRLRELPQPPPDNQYCEEDTHYVMPGPDYMQVGRQTLRAVLEEAEQLDLQFAKRVEGLTNCAASVCWDCRDPDFNPADRQLVVQQFVGKYMDRFYAQMGLGSTPPVEASMDEGVRRHREFCKEWARQHLRSLTPFVTGPAEVLTNMFYPNLSCNRDGRGALASCPEVARLFARHPTTTVEFASCLQFFTANLEQSRGNRNASYKQMNQVAAARNHELRQFGAALARAMPALLPVFEAIRGTDNGRYLSPYTVDWPDILAQIPTSHRLFDDVGAFGLMPARGQERYADQAPWRVNHP